MLNMLKIIILLTVVSVAQISQGAEIEVHPSIAVSEEFTDNIYETKSSRSSDFITRILPGLALSYKTPALTGNLSYQFDYRKYSRNTNEDEIAHTINATAKLIVVKNLLFLDLSDNYQRVSLDVTRDVTKESLFVDQSDRNVATISPYIQFSPTDRLMVTTRYKYEDTRYFNSTAVDKYSHAALLKMSYELTKRWSLTADYSFTRELADIDNYDQHQTLGGFRYEYAEKSFLFAQAGYNWTRYDSGQGQNSIIWNAGFTHTSDTVTGTMMTGVRFDEDPQSNIMQESFAMGIIEKRFKRGSASFSPMYSEYVDTKTDTPQTRKYGATVLGKYELTADLNGNIGFTAERYDEPLLSSYTRRFQVDSALNYLLAKELNLSISHVYTSYNSPDIASNNWYVNRIMMEIKKTF